MDKRTVEFLVEAKKRTYAGKGAETDPSRVGSHDLVWRDGDMMYYDSYLGGEKFVGEEALWLGGAPIWGMNYVGRVTGENFSGDFLKEALLNVPLEKPFRGPEQYSRGGYEYNCEVVGDFGWFQGRETIRLDGVEIYECFFHGGLIK